ncbi:MarR family winged helix-turn-helix transcriptional regulator [Sphingosinicella microcystinivorans]|uniref:MarR family winged helix-turn-helix transcriptional regulator n=1 Tax=Sphingosinicella microcystinivorans TaxID=335406 RepID=UPI0022F3A332|nr:MarR family transcriptional regulator [Sphingosinicella microcystinivorans]WBX84278.1 MarR family transcriptional regulator [Sphingosinicella microcystinivorans]
MVRKPFADFDLAFTAGHLLRRCHQRSHELFNETMAAFGLTRQQTALLIALLRQPGASVQELADITGTDRNTLGGIITRLVAKGLVDQRRSERDARAYELEISPQGLAMLRDMEAGVKLVQEQILAPLDPKERAAFIGYARKLAGLA